MSKKIYDIIGIGIGPFNLGLAALLDPIKELQCLFIDQNESFNWHPGNMIEGTRLQVPFYADLVMLADPCSRFSYLSFLKEKKRMFRFAIRENYFIKRTEYNEYCRWVAAQLSSLQFNTSCTSIEKENEFYRVRTQNGTWLAQKIVLGTGTVPFIPDFANTKAANVMHSADYLFNKEDLLDKDHITIVGNGQSAAEIFFDLLQHNTGRLSWFTRSPRFIPMDYSKLTLEMSTPDYIDHFFQLPDRVKSSVMGQQNSLYKGINQSLISGIYDLLDDKSDDRISIHSNCELTKITGDKDLTLHFRHTELEKSFSHDTNAVILATGYHAIIPACITPLRPFISLDKEGTYKAKRNYSMDEKDSIFIQNGEQSTHGFNASDLSLGPYRNAVIINSILGQEHYSIETGITFQSFGLPKLQRT
jgi:lysine N6-hydroxylase